ncbi:cartilage matrix protein [Aplysia californica]|uniref:Cartilage matrix protein n=1 Tax=Aplysia californica TaxID=6500 RepID=A0ABM0JNQ9_APLCA|nr:cartilage matrix protein [Aplysia californica]
MYVYEENKQASKLAFRVSDVRHVVIVITDGRSENYMYTQAQAKALKDGGALVFAIGVGSYVDDIELQEIASAPSNHYLFKTTGYDALPSIKDTLAIRACGQAIQQTIGRR